ncbi:thiamine pyrophosphate-binding protein [Paenibacillus eucommiae]|uniref:Acetolactate synthase-1/2/3 large subunit n=1 Tax=Paenibacillus eucommiae TaxID=1355755 RepID=A0ABS4J712_9BACL|nr:thiamine pyrophosphate-binding protein [Paenibacillus eucommiae]MBP1995595.1 acetolactate synthase-1/2/3 large subunit [Paenibacillus eucommiae]
MKLSDYVIEFIVKQGVSHIFEMVGGAIAHLLDSAGKRADISCVSVHHEQAGAFAAEGYARTNRKLGVAMATSGPGALNMLTGIGSCYFDSVPCLFVTGQVNTYEYKFERPLRQVGFQETDIVSIARPITKYAVIVTDPSNIRYQLEKAVYLAQTGRPGPVLLDIPMDVQRSEIEPDQLESFYESEEYLAANLQTSKCNWNEETFSEISSLLSASKRPLVLVGGGVRTAGAEAELLKFIDHTGIPVVTSLLGIDALPHQHPSFLGLIGSYGNRYSNLALANCDFLLILGSRLDSRQTGTRPQRFSRASRKVHVDIDVHELNAKVHVDMALQGDVRSFLQQFNNHLLQTMPQERDDSTWYSILHEYCHRFPDTPPSDSSPTIHPNRFMKLLSRHCTSEQMICLDVGQHQMWASQSFRLKAGQRLFNSGGMGAMGFALPAAIGAAMASGREIIVIAGDGGFQVNIQELETIRHHNLPIKMFVMDNNNLGMVRQFQDLYFQGRRQSSSKGYSCPDLSKVAEAYGIPSLSIHTWEEAERQIQAAMDHSGPLLIHIKLQEDTVVTPKLVVNRPIEDMFPHLEEQELKKLMVIEETSETEKGDE